jgi:hypothetical protein
LNTPKDNRYVFGLDRTLHTSLSRWAAAQVPPIKARRTLMETVRHEAVSQGRSSARQHSDLFVESLYLGPVISFNHTFGLFYSLHSRVRL